MYQAVVSAMNHPDPYNPYMGLFNARSFAALDAQGVELDVVSPRPIAPPAGPYSEYGRIPAEHDYGPYDVAYPRFAYLLPQKLFKYTLSSRSIQRMLPSYLEETVDTPDICHAGHIHYDGYGLLPYCRAHDIPLTVMGRGKILNNYHDMSGLAKRKIRETLEYADGILCVSDSLAQIAGDIVDESKATVLPNGAAPSRYPTENEPGIRAELGIDRETTVVLFCGGYTERKGIHEIREAVDDLDHDGLHMVFIGHYGDLRNDLIESLQGSPVDSYRVLWEVPPLALRRWFAVADIFMLPSHAEGRPNTVYESMASETAVVASAVSGIPEQITDEESGLLIPPRDPDALTAAVDRLIDEPDTRERLAENGLARLVSKGWTWEAHGERLAEIHRSILGQDGTPSQRAERGEPLVNSI